MAFEIMKLSWYKRRIPSIEPELLQYDVVDFKKIDDHKCVVVVEFDDHTGKHMLSGRVCASRIYKLSKPKPVVLSTNWTVNAIDSHGRQILLKLIE